MKRLNFFVLMVCIFFVLSACGTQAEPVEPIEETVEPVAAAVPTPSPTPEPPTPVDDDEAYANVAAEVDFSDFLNEDMVLMYYERTENEKGYNALLENIDVLEAAAERLKDDVTEAARSAFEKLHEQRPHKRGELTIDIDALSWRYAAMLGSIWGDDVVLNDFIEVTGSEDEQNMKITVALRDVQKTIENMSRGVANDYAIGRYTYGYLMTVHDHEGNFKAYEYPGYPEGYEETVVFPLPIETSRRDGWYDDRDGGDRRHTGMDFRAPEDTPILSCTDGIVMSIGTNEGAGHYVHVLDEYGYEYHYYHMVRQTDFIPVGTQVKAGDLIGHVGNTGNSSANHLHLSIFTPDGLYINPYQLMVDVYPY